MTDQGFLQEEALVWESLHNVEGDGNFCDSDFRLCHPPQRAPPSGALMPSAEEQRRQIDQVRQVWARAAAADRQLIDRCGCWCQDYLVAVSLQRQGGATGALSDLELARQLQQEEYQNQQQGAPTAAPQVTAARPRSTQQEVNL